jgi:hypothetical protein
LEAAAAAQRGRRPPARQRILLGFEATFYPDAAAGVDEAYDIEVDGFVEFDAAHRASGGCDAIILAVGYVGAHVDHGYARTVDTTQGATVDHSLFAPSVSASAERPYVAPSRAERRTVSTQRATTGGWTPSDGAARTTWPLTGHRPSMRRVGRRDTGPPSVSAGCP